MQGHAQHDAEPVQGQRPHAGDRAMSYLENARASKAAYGDPREIVYLRGNELIAVSRFAPLRLPSENLVEVRALLCRNGLAHRAARHRSINLVHVSADQLEQRLERGHVGLPFVEILLHLASEPLLAFGRPRAILAGRFGTDVLGHQAAGLFDEIGAGLAQAGLQAMTKPLVDHGGGVGLSLDEIDHAFLVHLAGDEGTFDFLFARALG